ncbi:MAG: NAD(P)/FAD-dependent oxidoreductase [Bilophila wadsworthia]
MEERTCDNIVLGGGPAGMTAAIYAKRANLDVVLLETNVTGGLVNSTYTVENFPSYPEIHGMELMEKMREHVDHMGVEVEEVFEVIGLELGEDEKAVHGDGIVYNPGDHSGDGPQAIALTPTECDQMHFCAICDGAPYRQARARGRRRE